VIEDEGKAFVRFIPFAHVWNTFWSSVKEHFFLFEERKVAMIQVLALKEMIVKRDIQYTKRQQLLLRMELKLSSLSNKQTYTNTLSLP
jgi:hypothetical protein